MDCAYQIWVSNHQMTFKLPQVTNTDLKKFFFRHIKFKNLWKDIITWLYFEIDIFWQFWRPLAALPRLWTASITRNHWGWQKWIQQLKKPFFGFPDDHQIPFTHFQWVTLMTSFHLICNMPIPCSGSHHMPLEVIWKS